MSLFGEQDLTLKKLSLATRIYKKVEEKYNVTRRDAFKTLVCPSRWESNPFDRWYKYKEGYSSLLIHRLLKEFDAEPNDPVFDPFLGSGTTLCGASSYGTRRGFGIEVNPFSYMLSSVKLRKYDRPAVDTIVSDIKNLFSGFKEWKKENDETVTPDLSIVNKLFGERTDRIVDVITFMKEVENDVSREFMLSGLGCILEQLSYAKKDGNGLRYPPGKEPLPISETLKSQYNMMIEDLRRHPIKGDFTIVNGDSRNVVYKDVIDGEVKHVIFSPPYANCFDYIEVYKIELWMLDFVKEYGDLKDLRDCTLSSHLNKTYEEVKPRDPLLERIFSIIDWKETWGGEKTSHMLVNYFNDMERVFENIASVLAPGGTVTCVVGNSAYDCVPIATDLPIARLMEKCGLHVTEIRVARPLLSSVQQKKKMGRNKFMRESLVMSKKL